MKSVVVFQALSKFGMFTFVVSYRICFIVFWQNWQKVMVILWHRIEGGKRNLENHVQNGICLPHALLLQYRLFFVFVFVVFQDKL